MLIIIALSAALATAAYCQDAQDDPAQDAAVEADAAVQVAPDDAASEDLSNILSDRPEVGISRPREAERPREPNLPREHSQVIDRRCRMELDKGNGWYVLHFVNEPGKKPEPNRFVLPTASLRQMQATLAQNPDTLFIVSGETLLYKEPGRANASLYILVTSLLEARPVVVAAPAPVAPAPADPAPIAPVASRPTPAPLPGNAHKPAGQDELVRRMLEEHPGRPIMVATEEPQVIQAPPQAPTAVAERVAKPYDRIIADRLARIELKDGWYVCRFLSDVALKEQPMRLLPCGNLNLAQKLSVSLMGRAVKLRISGEVFRYRDSDGKDKEFLLLRNVQPYRDMGQL